jgi:glycosyltransferase involved in cell wall biosynthesis
MRIAFLHQPNDPYTQVRMKYFVSKGHNVYSITFNTKVVQKPLIGVNLITLPYKLLSKVPFFKRIIYSKNIRDITDKNNIEIFYVVSALNSYYLKSSKAKRNFLEIQGSDVIISPRKFPFLKYFYKHFWKYADGITQDSELAKQKASPYLPKNVINETIEIGVDFNFFNPFVKKGLVRNKYNLGKRPIVFHSRGITKLYNLDIIIKSIPVVREKMPDVCFLFTGVYSALNKVSKKFIKDQNLNSNIIFCGRLDHETEMKYYYTDADLMISIPSSDSSPFSVYEAMATKTPVIASDLPWLEGKFLPNIHLSTVPVNAQKLADSVLGILEKHIILDLDGAYNVVFDKINMLTENKKLEQMLFESLKQ